MAIDAKAFIAFERAAHDRIAGSYAEHFAPLTTHALKQLLDAAGIAAGWRVLDVATGSGIAAASAHARGADVLGVDVSPAMVALARHTHPGIVFRMAEVTALPFSGGAFDAWCATSASAISRSQRLRCPNACAFWRRAAAWHSAGGISRRGSGCKDCSARLLPSWGSRRHLRCRVGTIPYASPTRTPSRSYCVAQGLMPCV
jgi:SAM-dependent methyltransferase